MRLTDKPLDPPPLGLHPDDAAAVDELLSGAPAPAADPARRQRVQAWLAVLSTARSVQPSSDLLARTLQAVEEDQMRRRLHIAADDQQTPANGWRLGRQFGEFAAMALAASVLLAVLIPGLSAARRNAQKASCASNLAVVGAGFEAYAAGQHDALPDVGLAAETNWMTPANSANLQPLLGSNPALARRLLCPARDPAPADADLTSADALEAARGYSYINLISYTGAGAAHRPSWDHQPGTFVLADRNPLFAPEHLADPHANSLNHGLKGTNILAADRSVRWATSPDVGPAGDNIWTINLGPEPQPAYTGLEKVSRADDLFLSP